MIKRLFCFSREIAGQVKYPYFKHWLASACCACLSNIRSSRPEVLYELVVLKSFAKFTGKLVLESLYYCWIITLQAKSRMTIPFFSNYSFWSLLPIKHCLIAWFITFCWFSVAWKIELGKSGLKKWGRGRLWVFPCLWILLIFQISYFAEHIRATNSWNRTLSRWIWRFGKLFHYQTSSN